jgi:integrase
MKRPRYQRGFFSRLKRKSGPDVWMYRWRETGPKGQARMRKQVIGTLEQYPSKTAAWRAVELLRLDINYEAPRPESLPANFGELIKHYRKIELDRHQPSARKTDQTKHVYDSNLRTHIEPRWQQYRLREITSVAVEKWLATVNLADGSKAKLKYIMSDVFQHGIRYGWLKNAENPMLAVRQSAKRVRLPEPLEAGEFLRLLTKLPLKIRTMGIVCATTGLRISEVLGLKWGDIDFQELLFHVTRSVVDGVIGKCKTETSRKPLPLDEMATEHLQTWREASVYSKPEDWVFASEWRDGKMPPWADTLLDRYLRPAAQAAGITKRVGWHTFRHTYSTLLQANENDVKVVQELMRHANVTTTMNVYTQAITSKKRQAQSRVVDLLFGRKGAASATAKTDIQRPFDVPRSEAVRG